MLWPIDRGYGTAGIDFLLSDKKAPNIITNPPFQLAYEFIVQGLQAAEKNAGVTVAHSLSDRQKARQTLCAIPAGKSNRHSQ